MINEESIIELFTPTAENINEIEKLLMSSETRMTKIKYNDMKLIFIKNTYCGEPFYVQRIENEFYGKVFYKNTWLHSYPHLRNIRDTTTLTMEKSVIEKKENGTNIGIGRYPHGDIIRTRMSPFPEEFPITAFFNSTINEMVKSKNTEFLLNMRNEMLKKYPHWYIVSGDYEYVGLKVQEVVNEIIDVKNILNAYSDHQFYFELIGKINPIIIDSELEFGFYDFDYKMILLDIYNRKESKFVDRETKEKIAKELNLNIVPIHYSFNTIDSMRKSITAIKKEAEINKIEGYVLKNESEIVKIKPDIILQSAYRLNSILKGYIYGPDILNYISKVITKDYLSKPDEYETLITLIIEEARADYNEKIISKSIDGIRKRIAETMAVMVVIDIMEEQTFENKNDLFRYINQQLPIRFAPLKTYVDFETEKTTEDEKLRKNMKRKRKAIFDKVSKYCMKVLNEYNVK